VEPVAADDALSLGGGSGASQQQWTVGSVATSVASSLYVLGGTAAAATADAATYVVKRATTASSSSTSSSSSASSSSSSSSPAPPSAPPAAQTRQLPAKAQGTVLVVDVRSLKTIVHFHATGSASAPVGGLFFDPAGTWLLTAPADGCSVRLHQVGPGTARLRYKLQRGITRAVIRHAFFSPDRRWVGVTSDRGTSHLFCLDAEGVLSESGSGSRNRSRGSSFSGIGDIAPSAAGPSASSRAGRHQVWSTVPKRDGHSDLSSTARVHQAQDPIAAEASSITHQASGGGRRSRGRHGDGGRGQIQGRIQSQDVGHGESFGGERGNGEAGATTSHAYAPAVIDLHQTTPAVAALWLPDDGQIGHGWSGTAGSGDAAATACASNHVLLTLTQTGQLASHRLDVTTTHTAVVVESGRISGTPSPGSSPADRGGWQRIREQLGLSESPPQANAGAMDSGMHGTGELDLAGLGHDATTTTTMTTSAAVEAVHTWDLHRRRSWDAKQDRLSHSRNGERGGERDGENNVVDDDGNVEGGGESKETRSSASTTDAVQARFDTYLRTPPASPKASSDLYRREFLAQAEIMTYKRWRRVLRSSGASAATIMGVPMWASPQFTLRTFAAADGGASRGKRARAAPLFIETLATQPVSLGLRYPANGRASRIAEAMQDEFKVGDSARWAEGAKARAGTGAGTRAGTRAGAAVAGGSGIGDGVRSGISKALLAPTFGASKADSKTCTTVECNMDILPFTVTKVPQRVHGDSDSSSGSNSPSASVRGIPIPTSSGERGNGGNDGKGGKGSTAWDAGELESIDAFFSAGGSPVPEPMQPSPDDHIASLGGGERSAVEVRSPVSSTDAVPPSSGAMDAAHGDTTKHTVGSTGGGGDAVAACAAEMSETPESWEERDGSAATVDAVVAAESTQADKKGSVDTGDDGWSASEVVPKAKAGKGGKKGKKKKKGKKGGKLGKVEKLH
jgi:hypothetical protein